MDVRRANQEIGDPRILLLITDLQIGGTPTVVRELALRLSAAGGAEVEVACLAPWGPVADQIAAGGIKVTALNASGALSLPIVLWRLLRLIRTGRIDTVFSFLIHANMVAAAVSPLCGWVRFFQSIQTTQPFPRWHWKLQRLIGGAAERIIVPSDSVAEAARRWAHVPEDKIVVIPNAIDIDDFNTVLDFAGSAARSDVPVATERVRNADPAKNPAIGFIGRLDPIKRIPDLLQAIQLLHPSTLLHIFGEGAERAHIEAMVLRLDLNNRVVLHGAVSDPREALRRIDLLVLPSQAEGFGLVLIEAMAAGIPVVATDVPGIRDVVKNGETGLLVPVASPGKLADAIGKLLNNPALRQRLMINAKKDVGRRFSWEIALPMYRTMLGISD